MLVSVHRCGAGLAVGHASALKDIKSVLTLLQEKVVVSLLHEDAHEVVVGRQVLHGELLPEGCSVALKKLRARV
jgi:hypothetical protein